MPPAPACTSSSSIAHAGGGDALRAEADELSPDRLLDDRRSTRPRHRDVRRRLPVRQLLQAAQRRPPRAAPRDLGAGQPGVADPRALLGAGRGRGDRAALPGRDGQPLPRLRGRPRLRPGRHPHTGSTRRSRSTRASSPTTTPSWCAAASPRLPGTLGEALTALRRGRRRPGDRRRLHLRPTPDRQARRMGGLPPPRQPLGVRALCRCVGGRWRSAIGNWPTALTHGPAPVRGRGEIANRSVGAGHRACPRRAAPPSSVLEGLRRRSTGFHSVGRRRRSASPATDARSRRGHTAVCPYESTDDHRRRHHRGCVARPARNVRRRAGGAGRAR